MLKKLEFFAFVFLKCDITRERFHEDFNYFFSFHTISPSKCPVFYFFLLFLTEFHNGVLKHRHNIVYRYQLNIYAEMSTKVGSKGSVRGK